MDYKTSVCDHKRWEHQQWARIIVYSVSRIVYLISLGTVWIVSLLQLAKITNTLYFLFVTSGFWIGLNVFFFVNTELKKTRHNILMTEHREQLTIEWKKTLLSSDGFGNLSSVSINSNDFIYCVIVLVL